MVAPHRHQPHLADQGRGLQGGRGGRAGGGTLKTAKPSDCKYTWPHARPSLCVCPHTKPRQVAAMLHLCVCAADASGLLSPAGGLGPPGGGRGPGGMPCCICCCIMAPPGTGRLKCCGCCCCCGPPPICPCWPMLGCGGPGNACCCCCCCGSRPGRTYCMCELGTRAAAVAPVGALLAEPGGAPPTGMPSCSAAADRGAGVGPVSSSRSISKSCTHGTSQHSTASTPGSSTA